MAPGSTRHLALVTAICALCAPGTLHARSVTLLDDDWNFSLTPDSALAVSPVKSVVDLPHDWSVSLPFDHDAPAGNDGAYLPTGTGTYTKTINLSPADLAGSRHFLLLEGVYERCTLSVNGKEAAFRPYGYSSAVHDITPWLQPGENIIEIVADNSRQKNSRWYTGSGIYRHVKLIRTGETFVRPWSVFVTTPDVSREHAQVNVSFTVDGLQKASAPSARLTVTDGDGRKVAETSVPVAGSDAAASIDILQPALWSPDTPALYTLQIDILSDGQVVDAVTETFGIRTLSFSAAEGFRLNGEPTLINGACAHHDNGILGAASYDAAEARKVRLLKEAGFNAVRTSHNPPSPAFLDECDRQGLMVIDEAFDGWRDAKNPHDYSEHFDNWAIRDVGDMVLRDRNHPSVIAWSIGNEVIERKKIEIVTTARRLARECHRLDPTRPVTQALCAWDSDWEIYDPLAEELDITGYNYMIHKSATDHERDPQRIMWQTESYPRDAYANWLKVSGNPYIIGDFVWTGIDYLGESGIGRYFYSGQTEGEHFHRPQWPWHGAYCGDIDITGWRKPVSHYREMLYNPSRRLYMAVREPDGYHGSIRTTMWGVWPTWESWNWSGHEGKPIEVEVISRYPGVRLYLDDKLVGEQSVPDSAGLKAVFTIPYAPGTLRAAGVDASGSEAEHVTLATAGAPCAVRLTPDKTIMTADNQDITFVIAEITDRHGNVVPDAAIPLSFSVSGPASVLASGSADLTSMEPYSTPSVTTWKGRAIVAVKSTRRTGAIRLTATSPSLPRATLRLTSR